jgi:SAM-dependent methyltransferase
MNETERVDAWLAALERRHLADLTFAEVGRALRALSSCYVERRGRIAGGSPLDGAGKRAAFALYYGPLHFLLLRHILSSVDGELGRDVTVLDVGCGTGVAGAAWSLTSGTGAQVFGMDRSEWAVREAHWTWHALGISGRARRGDALDTVWPRKRLAIVSAFTANELAPETRVRMRERLEERASSGDAILIVEPIARGVAPWWNEWRERWQAFGVRDDEWRIPVTLPDIVARLDRAVGMRHEELTSRSLFVKPKR